MKIVSAWQTGNKQASKKLKGVLDQRVSKPTQWQKMVIRGCHLYILQRKVLWWCVRRDTGAVRHVRGLVPWRMCRGRQGQIHMWLLPVGQTGCSSW